MASPHSMVKRKKPPINRGLALTKGIALPTSPSSRGETVNAYSIVSLYLS